MIKLDTAANTMGEAYFTCDECPMCIGLEHRLKTAEEGGYTPQLEYCCCDKVSLTSPFYAAGYCQDAFENRSANRTCGERKTGRAYRRKKEWKLKNRAKLLAQLGLAGHLDAKREYVIPQRKSRAERIAKKHANRAARRNKMTLYSTSGAYRKAS